MPGVRSEEVRKKLLALTPFPQLEAVVALCRSEESAEKTDADLASVPALVNAASRSRHPQPSGPQQQSGHAQEDNSCSQCRYCGRRSHKARTDCPAYGTTCQSCGKQHHFAEVCEARGRKRQGQLSSFRHHVRSVHSISPRERPRVNVTIATCTSPHSRILGEFFATPDTGADVTIMGRVQFNLLGITSDQLEAPLGQEVFAANGQPLDCLGTLNLTFHLGSLLIGSQSSTRWTEFSWHGTLLEIWEFSPNYPTPLPSHTKATRLQVGILAMYANPVS